MKGRTFYILDVFAEKKYAGNQLAVFTDAAGLSDETMQAIARELNFSETTFILSRQPEDGAYPVRIFTPAHEVPFAGHPTLGTAFVLQQEIIAGKVEQVVLNLAVGRIPVDIHYHGDEPRTFWMKQIAPSFGDVMDTGAAARMLGLDAAEIDERFPIQEVSTGLPFLIVPLRRLASMRRIRLSREEYFSAIEKRTAKAVLVFCREAYDRRNDLNARMFGDYYGVPEDPATGSAAGCLAGYLVRHRCCGGPSIDLRMEQGCEIGRPSLLLLKAADNGDGIDVRVGGGVIRVARGELF